MFTLRDMVADDVPQVVEVIRTAFEEYRGLLDPPSSAHGKTAEIVQRELTDGGGFVACEAQTLVGCVFYHIASGHLYFDRLAVLPGYRRQGIAYTLVQAVERHAKHCGLSEVRLSVRLALEGNQAYYERLGYTFLNYGTHPGYTAPTSVTLYKQI